jgi:hypothetical protein
MHNGSLYSAVDKIIASYQLQDGSKLTSILATWYSGTQPTGLQVSNHNNVTHSL